MRNLKKFEDQEIGPKAKSLGAARVFVVMLALLASPVVYEFGNLTCARWESVIGRGRKVQTPILNAIEHHASEFRSQFNGMSTKTFRKVKWRPSTIVPLAIGFALIAALFLWRGI